MTARWEHQLQLMVEKKQSYQPFIHTLVGSVSQLIEQVKVAPVPASLRNLPPVERKTFRRGRKAGSGSKGSRSRSARKS
jgi:DNA topoisomerase-3